MESKTQNHCFWFLASMMILCLGQLSLGAECDSSMMYKNPFGKGSADCTLPSVPKSNAQQQNRNEADTRFSTPIEVSKLSIENSIGLSTDAMRDNIKEAGESGYRHPDEAELIKINQAMNQSGDNFAKKMEYIQKLPSEIRSLAATVIVGEFQYEKSGQQESLDALLKYKDLIDSKKFREMVAANLVDLRQLDDPNEQAALHKKAQVLVDNLESSKSPNESSYCTSMETLMNAMNLEDMKDDRTVKFLEGMGIHYSKQRIQLAAAAFAKEMEPANHQCGTRIKFKTKLEIFQMLQNLKYLSGREDFVVAALRNQPQKLVPLSSDYQACKMSEIQSEIDSQTRALEEGHRKMAVSFLRTTSANCGIQIIGKALGSDKVEIRIWNSKGLQVSKANQVFASASELKNFIRGPYNQPEPEGVIPATAVTKTLTSSTVVKKAAR